ncbi:MAG TPA: TetR/AcrR family transcriptional regulator [Parvibaculum sp.]|jgi:AcrR family transcriptional regulator
MVGTSGKTQAKDISNRVSAADWIDAAMRLLAREGVDAIRIDRLCADLAVTKGSFYWHFPNREALVAAIALDWASRRPQTTFETIRALDANPREKLYRLFDLYWRDDIVRFDRAMRAWALSEPAIRKAIIATDREMLGFVAGLFEEMSYPKDDAHMRAATIFFTGIGMSAAPHLVVPSEDDGREKWLNMILGPKP